MKNTSDFFCGSGLRVLICCNCSQQTRRARFHAGTPLESKSESHPTMSVCSASAASDDIEHPAFLSSVEIRNLTEFGGSPMIGANRQSPLSHTWCTDGERARQESAVGSMPGIDKLIEEVARRANSFFGDTRGIILPYVTILLVVIIGVSALALDGVRSMPSTIFSPIRRCLARARRGASGYRAFNSTVACLTAM